MFISMIQREAGVTPAASSTTRTAGAENGSFHDSLRLHIAEMEAHAMNTLLLTSPRNENGQSTRNETFSTTFDALLNPSTANSASNGRNTALFDPESAYRMMTTINGKDVSYKAEYAEMSAMKSYVSTMEDNAEKLGALDIATTSNDISLRLQTFATAYNEWIDRFDQDIEPGGILHGTRAAQISQWELEQSINNRFNGASDGLHGMTDVGFSIDPTTHFLSFDQSRLDSALATNKAGAINTVREFSANFAKSADLLGSENNFISNRLGNLSRAINFIDTNKPALQTEFGRGDDVQPTGLVKKALAAYDAIVSTASIVSHPEIANKNKPSFSLSQSLLGVV